MAEPWTYSAAGDVAERWDWLTEVLAPPTGEEQRIRLRLSPRIVQQFDSLESATRRRWMENALVANGAGDWDIPMVQDTSLLTGAALAGATGIGLDTTLRRFFAGSRVLLIGDDPRVYEVATIAPSGVAAGSLTLVSGLASGWPAGTRVIPLFQGRLASIPDLERFTGDDVPVRIEFQLTDYIDWPTNAGSSTYRSLPVLELQADWSQAPTFTPERRLAIVDNETGIPTWYDQPGVPFSLHRRGFTLTTREQIAAFWGLLYALAGRCEPIWVPTLAHDFEVVSALTVAGTTLDVTRCGMSAWPLKPNRRDIRIQLVDGTVLYRRITDADLLNPTTERLTLDAAIGVNAGAEDVVLVSFLELCRQDTDTNLLRYWAEGVVLTELTLRAYLNDL